jgi:hypothetical protein
MYTYNAWLLSALCCESTLLQQLQLLVLADSSSQVKPLRAPLQLSEEQVQEAERYAAVATTVKPAQQQPHHHKHIVLLNW